MRGLAAGAVLAVALLAAAPAQAFDLQGHRGARGLAPENTVAGFETALATGVTTLELDVGLTRDDVLVVYHDRTLNPDITRDADGRWLATRGPALRSLDAAALRRYDVGRIRPDSRYATTFATQVPVDGARIPTLDEVFERVRALGANAVRFNVETKLSPLSPDETVDAPAFAAAVAAAVRRHGLGGRTTIQSFDWRTLREVQRIAPEIATVYLTSQQPNFDTIGATAATPSAWTAGLRHAEHGSVPRMVKAAGGAVWSPNALDLDPERIAEARALGLKVVPWTVNDPQAMRRLIDAGVDGLITDRPDLLRAAMAERGLPLPAPVPAARAAAR
jgi:glycerophosphoryl diester phosphodiesterase